jgi:hypothetical protein
VRRGKLNEYTRYFGSGRYEPNQVGNNIKLDDKGNVCLKPPAFSLRIITKDLADFGVKVDYLKRMIQEANDDERYRTWTGSMLVQEAERRYSIDSAPFARYRENPSVNTFNAPAPPLFGNTIDCFAGISNDGDSTMITPAQSNNDLASVYGFSQPFSQPLFASQDFHL